MENLIFCKACFKHLKMEAFDLTQLEQPRPHCKHCLETKAARIAKSRDQGQEGQRVDRAKSKTKRINTRGSWANKYFV